MSKVKQIGRCSVCNGAVVVESGPWWGVKPPTPYCTSCDAVPSVTVDEDLPIIAMENKNSESQIKLLHS